MAISTVRPDGWPQTTIVGYANDGLQIYFLIFRASQKFANIEKDDRISFAVGAEPIDVRNITAVYSSAHACEVTEPPERARAWNLLARRHPNLRDFVPPPEADAAMMRASCEHLSVLDYTKGFGYTEELIADSNATWTHPLT
jgi:nitroimidazol reductase NimA-like FMN-containing flavoprotein (pyridoxamine 5'-phosphate oxidase superfamily)